MNLTNQAFIIKAVSLFIISGVTTIVYSNTGNPVSNEVIEEQRGMLAKSTKDAGFGPQSPRDIDSGSGNNDRIFETAPPYTQMNLCNIHFHESAEHKGGDFTKYAGNGDGEGNHTGYAYSGELSTAELSSIEDEIGVSEHGSLVPGDTIEVHYVYSTAKVEPGSTLGACLSDAINNPQLRVEAQVYVLVNDDTALDFMELTRIGKVDKMHQALNIPSNTGKAIQYAGSTTGPGFNKKGSPFQVTWSVRPKIAKVNIRTVGTWLSDNVFSEDHAHGVRNLVTNPKLLSQFTR